MLKYIYRRLKNSWRKFRFFSSINWIKTLYFNFKMLPFHDAIKFPVFFFGPVKFTSLKGKVVINSPLRSNIISFGFNLEMIRTRIGNAEVRIDGTLIVNGRFFTSNDYKIIILNNATLEIGESSHFGSRTTVVATYKIKLGKFFRLSNDSQVIDSNFHFLLDMENNRVLRMSSEVNIGDYCWVSNRSSIMKGTKTPRYLLIASNSILNKDYMSSVSEYSLIGGTPAKLIRENITRVWDENLEKKIIKYFRENPEEIFIQNDDILEL